MQHQLQGMISKARGRGSADGSGAAVRKSTGSDGVRYVLEDPRDYGKYHVLSDSEVAEEERRSMELAYAKAGAKASSPGPGLRGRSSSPKASQAKPWSATMDDKAGAHTKVHDFLDSRGAAEDYKAGSKSPPSSPSYRKVVGGIGRTIASESQEKLRHSLGSSLPPRAPRPVSAVALARKPLNASGDLSAAEQQRGRPATAAAAPGTAGDAAAAGGAASAPVRRSMSAGKSRLLDNDAYILRKEWAEARERAEREEREAYELELKERTLRASKNGKEFEAMRKRAEKCHERNTQKAMEKKTKADEAERRAKLDRDEKRKAHLNKQLSKNGELSWKEMLEQQEIRRRENVEKHKQELLLKSRAPTGAFKDAENKKDGKAAAAAAAAAAGDFQFKADDPARVAAKLAKMQRAWDLAQEAKRKLQEERDAARKLAASGKLKKPSLVKGMEDREADAKARHAKREADRVAKEAAADQKRKEDERRRAEKLANIKIPEEAQRLTKSAKNRADMVQKMKNDEKERLAREEREKARKARIERDMALTLKAIIDEREQERKTKLGSFTELSNNEAKVAEAAKALQAEYKRRRKENEARLREVVAARPSLIERHEQVRLSAARNDPQ